MLPASRPTLVATLGLLLAFGSLGAQTRYRVGSEGNFRADPGPQARLLARVSEGSSVLGGQTRDGWVEINLEGWIWERSVRKTSSSGFDLAVSSAGGENLRVAPNGGVIARLLTGFLLDELERKGGWVRVRRSGWMWSRTLTRETASTEPASGMGADVPAPTQAADMLDRATVAAGAPVFGRPAADTVGTLGAPVPARVVARADGWARVAFEGWVRESDLLPPSSDVLTGVSGAEVRAGGDEFAGKLLRWTLQYIALQTADELRRDMPPGQRYMLARGPMPEMGFVYVLVSPDQARALEALSPLAYVTVVGRVRTARSQYLGNPILDLVDFAVATQ